MAGLKGLEPQVAEPGLEDQSWFWRGVNYSPGVAQVGAYRDAGPCGELQEPSFLACPGHLEQGGE